MHLQIIWSYLKVVRAISFTVEFLISNTSLHDLFMVLHPFQHCICHIMMGSIVGRVK